MEVLKNIKQEYFINYYLKISYRINLRIMIMTASALLLTRKNKLIPNCNEQVFYSLIELL